MTWLCWGGVAQSQIQAYSMSFSLCLIVSLFTSLATLVVIGSKSLMAKKQGQNNNSKSDPASSSSFQTAFTTLQSSTSEPRLYMLVIVDIAKLFLSLLMLSQAPNITIWFFMVFADGTGVFLFKKVKEQLTIERKYKEIKESGNEISEE